jgi:murein DD-endopeptidase MepM/ murein hydrolase activator NlpD
MSHRQASSQSYPGAPYRHAPHVRGKSVAVALPGADYMLAHAGRQLRIGPIVFWVVVGTLVIMAIWTIITATYFAFRDDVLTGLIARQAEMQYAYEDRIADLRATIDRMSSRQLLNQEQYEQKLDEVVQRQSALEHRTNALQAMPDGIVTGSVRPTGREQTRSVPNRPRPVNDKSSGLIPDRARNRNFNVAAALERLQGSLDRVEARQAASLSSMEERYDAKARRIHGILTELGIDAAHPRASNVGGPLVAARLPANAGTFEHHVHRVHVARAQADRLTRTLASVPLRTPVLGEPDVSSGFGMRIDPFIRAPAMHTGMDFRGDTGDVVRATADGTVTVAGLNGGYGNMVEISHGNGLTTRYAHLSDVNVKIGQRVRAGHIIGKVGSTGRSTGPHLHYETRVGGDAVDPRRFLRAGIRLGLH